MDATASGPNLFAIDPWTPGNPIPRRAYALFSEEQSAKLATIASLVRFKRRETIYQAGEQAGAAFVSRTGVVKTFWVDGNGVTASRPSSSMAMSSAFR